MTITAPNYYVVNSIPLDTFGWRTVDTGYDLLLESPPFRGENVVMDGAPGRRAYPIVWDEAAVSIPMLIVGSLTEDGVPISNSVGGMKDHKRYLDEGLVAGADANRGTVDSTFYWEDGDTWTGEVQVLGLFGFTSLGGGEALVRLDLRIPASRLEETGS